MVVGYTLGAHCTMFTVSTVWSMDTYSPVDDSSLKIVIVRTTYILRFSQRIRRRSKRTFLWGWNHCRNALAKSAAVILLTAPSHSLKVSWFRVRPAGSLCTLGNRKLSAGAKSGEYGGC